MLASAGGNDVSLWDVRTGALRHRLKGYSLSVFTAAFSPDGTMLASGIGQEEEGKPVGAVYQWDVRAGMLKRILTGNLTGVSAIAFSPDGKALATGHMGAKAQEWIGEINLWDVRTGRLKWKLKGHFEWVESIAFSPDSRILASGGGLHDEAGEVILWKVRTGKLKRTLTYNESMSVVFLPGNKMMIIERRNGTISLWDARTRKLKFTLSDPNAGTSSVIFSPGDRMLANSSCYDSAVKLWDTLSGRLLATLIILPSGRAGKVSSEWMVFTPEGYYNGSAGAKRFIRWRGEIIFTLRSAMSVSSIVLTGYGKPSRTSDKTRVPYATRR